MPTDAPITAAGMMEKKYDPTGRDAQSIAILECPRDRPVYSGVTNSSASSLPIASFQRDRLLRVGVGDHTPGCTEAGP